MFSSAKFMSLMKTSLAAALAYASKVTVLLKGNSTGTGTGTGNFVDYSSNNFSITKTGTPIQTAKSPFDSGASCYLDGSSYLNLSGQSNFAFGTGDFTIEGWFNVDNVTGSKYIYSGQAGGSYQISPDIYVNVNKLWFQVSNTNPIQGTTAISPNTWYHFALCRSGNSTKLFLNGVQEGNTFTDTYNYIIPSLRPCIGTYGYNGNVNQFKGYISNIRVVKGTALYTSNFTVPTTPLENISGTSLLMSFNDYVLDNKTFLDSSSNHLPVTTTGTPTQGSFSPYGKSWSTYFNGTSDGLSFVGSSNLVLGTGDFTIECWIKMNALPTTTMAIIEARTSTAALPWILEVTSSNFNIYNGSPHRTSGITPVVNKWYHIAICRASGVSKFYVDGISYFSWNDSFNYNNGANTIYIGKQASGYYFNGFISNIRIIKGSAVYTSNFTVPTEPLQAITGTQLLTCQSNRLMDNSSNNFAITSTGTPKVVKNSPFLTNTYDPSVDNGSLYFNGTTDMLTVPSNSNLTLGITPFTVEFWMYPIGVQKSSAGIYTSNAYGTNGILGIQYYNTSGFGINTYNAWIAYTSELPRINTWTHIAITRDSSNGFKVFFNGVLKASGTHTVTYIETPMVFGATWSDITNNGFKGYISNFRVIKDTALYTSDFTVPTAPVMSISGTQLLLNGTNGCIVDNSKLQDWLSYGNAQVTTSNKKYGTGCIKLDAGGYLQTPITSPPQINMTAGSTWTIEAWIYKTGTVAESNVANGIGDYSSASDGNAYWSFGIISTNALCFYWWPSTPTKMVSTSLIPLNTWTHVAVTCKAGTLQLWINGQADGGTATLTTPTSSLGYLTIGQYKAVTCPLLIDDLRITNGEAVYTANFTPPTEF